MANSNVRFYKLSALPNFEAKHKGIFVHVTGTMHNTPWDDLSDKEKNKLIESIGLEKKDFVLTCIARLDKNKNQSFLINAMEELVKENSNIHLLLVGPDELNGYYQNMVSEKKLGNNIHFLGRREDISQLLSISDIVVSASLREGLPVNVMEAFAAGKPVVALNCRGMKDLIDDGKNGFIVYDESEFLERILYIKNNYLEFINKCVSYTNVDKFDVNAIAQRIKKIYFN